MSAYDLKFVEIHGHDVGYRRAGEGSAVVFIHGMAGSSHTWREVMPAIAERHEVIAPDLLGHGESAKPMGDYSLGAFASGLRDLLTVLEVPSVTVVGQSLGGGVAMQLAYQHPELVERLVLVGSGGLGREVSWILRLLTLPGSEYLMPLFFPRFVTDSGNAVSGRLAGLGLRLPNVAELWRAYASLSGAPDRQAFIRTLRAVIDPGGQSVSANDRLYLTAVLPTMIVWGDADPIIPVEHAYAAHEAMPGSRLEIFEGAGHFPHVEEPKRFTEVLMDFLDSTEPSLQHAHHYRELIVAHEAS